MIKIDVVRKWFLLLLPLVMLIMQGLYKNIQCAIVIIITLLLICNISISIKQLVGVILLFGGLFISDVFVGDSTNFIYEGLKVTLLLSGIAVSNKDDKKNLFIGFYIGISFASAIGIIAYIFKLNVHELLNIIDGQNVLQGFLGYANTMALFSGIGIILSTYYMSLNKDYKFIHECLLLINVIAFILTKSLFAYACLAATAMIALFVKRKSYRKYILIFAGILLTGIIGIFICGKEELILRSTVVSRLIYWSDALRLLIRYPFGIGVHNWEQMQFAIQSADYSVKYVHNSFLQLLLDGGIVSFVGFVILIVCGYAGIIKKYKENSDNFYIILITILTFIVLHSFVDINFAYGIVWFIIGLILSFSKTDNVIKSKFILPILLAVIAVITVFIPESEYVNPYPIEYNRAYRENDLEKMDIISAEWIENSPKQQAAYDARFYVLDKLNDDNGLHKLQYQKEQANSTMNRLCRYLTLHKEIVLPEVVEK